MSAVTESTLNALKLPPQAIEAEQSVLGGLLLDNQRWDDVAEQVSVDDFYSNNHRQIYLAISSLCQESNAADVVTASEWLEKNGELDKVGGLAYLGTLAKNTPSTANITAYAKIVRERSVLRRLITAANGIIESAYTPQGKTPHEVLDYAEQIIFDIAQQDSRRGAGFTPLKGLLTEAINRIEELFASDSAVTGVATGYDDLDSLTSGLQPSDLVIIAGRPSMGKCIAHDSEILMDDGSVATIDEIHRNRRGQQVGTLSKKFKLGRSLPSDYIDDGQKPVFEVTTRLGRRIETTLTHPYLTFSGWKPLFELQVGDTVALPRRLPVFGSNRLRECEIKLLAYLIGDGCLTGNTVQFTNGNPRIAFEFRHAVAAFGGVTITDAERRSGFTPSWRVSKDRESIRTNRSEFAARLDGSLVASSLPARAVAGTVGVVPASVTYWRQGKCVPDQRSFDKLCAVLNVEATELAPNGLSPARKNNVNPLTRWLQKLGLMGHDASQKTIPEVVFSLQREQLCLFLNRLFATDGWATVLSSGQAQLGYASVNERLARQVQHLLLRFGVIASLRQRLVKYKGKRRPSWQLNITHAESILTFTNEIGIFSKEDAVTAAAKQVAQRRRQTNTDLLPIEIWQLIKNAKGPLSWSELARKAGVPDSNIHAGRRRLSRSRLAKFGLALGNSELLALANSDVYWDQIVSIDSKGKKQVYDLTIPDSHNFVANDICVHNTSLAMNIAENASVGNKLPVAIFSMEMPGQQLAMRMMASLGRINAHKIRTGKLNDDDWPRLTSAVGMLNDAPVFIDDTPSLSPLEIRARARRLAREHGLGLIVLDYLQLMQSGDNSENRATEISGITRSLKILAKELNVPIVALSQLNRSLEQRPNKRPVMSDLRESGAIEQDADVILFIYRDEVYNEDSPEKGVAEIIVAKQRNGPIGTVRLTFLGEYTRFESYARPEFEGAY